MMRRLLVLFGHLVLAVIGGQAHAQLELVQILVLAGQSNMEGKAKVSLLPYQRGLPEHQELLGHLLEEGRLKTRHDGFVHFHRSLNSTLPVATARWP